MNVHIIVMLVYTYICKNTHKEAKYYNKIHLSRTIGNSTPLRIKVNKDKNNKPNKRKKN